MKNLLKRMLSMSPRDKSNALPAAVENKHEPATAEIQTTEALALASDELPLKPKSERILKALAHREGASIDQLCVLTGWTRHAVRARLSRLRKAGVQLELHEKSLNAAGTGKVRIYHMASACETGAQL